MSDLAQQRLLELKNNLPLFCRLCLKIVNKEGKLVPFELNEDQWLLHNEIEKQLREIGMVRMVVVKGRKQGVSTYIQARNFHKAYFKSYTNVFILSHMFDSTKVIFNMVWIFYNNLPAQLKPKLLIENKQEIQFENFSTYTVATAGSGEVGRGATPHCFHGSEVASYENTEGIEAGAFESIAMALGTEMILESTARGPGGLFHKYAMMAIEKIGVFRLFFLPWFMHKANSFPLPEGGIQLIEEEQRLLEKYPQITLEQLYWRRLKIAEKGAFVFQREYPATIEEAFSFTEDTFFNPETIFNARKSKIKDTNAPYIIGCDAARDGDRTVLVHRRGREVFKIERFQNMKETRLAGIIAQHLNSSNPPEKVFLDKAYALGTIDILEELGYSRQVQGVYNQQEAISTDLYANKRSENAFALREWLEDEVSLPDDDDISMDLLAIPKEQPTSNGRWILPKKADIKKKFGKSPDIFDALCLTFSYPVSKVYQDGQDPMSKYNIRSSKKTKDFKSPVMDSFSRAETSQPQVHRREYRHGDF